jgi:hypothetical protein
VLDAVSEFINNALDGDLSLDKFRDKYYVINLDKKTMLTYQYCIKCNKKLMEFIGKDKAIALIQDIYNYMKGDL